MVTDLQFDVIDVNNVPTDDKSYNQSWYFDSSRRSNLSLDVEGVWSDYTGEGVKVAVIDSAIDHQHADLVSNYDAKYDYDFSTNSTNIVHEDRQGMHLHGTQVAGVIAGANNNIGSVGVAHGSSISSLALDYSSNNTSGQIINALYAAANFDIVNCSWSFNTAFADNFAYDFDYAAALAAPATTGRDGLGTVAIFSAGNTGEGLSSNYHSFQNSPFSIAVGAVDRDGGASSFTAVGSNVLVSAGGRDVFTTRPDDRYDVVNGTSFSAPIVTGVVALMLEANPGLGYRDVQQILALSAQTDDLDPNVDHGTGWVTNGASNHNGGGMQHSDAYGFGFVNAHDAVRLAETWTLQQTAENRESVSSTENFNGPRLVAGQNDTLSFSINVNADVLVEHVQLQLDFNYKYVEDLDITLTSPSGTTVNLTYATGDAIGERLTDFPFTSVAAMGESAVGEWLVEINNRNPDAIKSNGGAQEGWLRDYTLTVHGAKEDSDDTYVYTDAFGTLSTNESVERGTLNDTDGGIDAINAAAVTSNSTIDLSGATNSIIAGQNLMIEGANIENAFGGDGDDLLIGSAGQNWLRGGRGDDAFIMSGGNDVIWGERGIDTAILEIELSEFGGLVTGLQIGTELTVQMNNFGTWAFFDVELFKFTDVSLTFDAFLNWLTDNADGTVDAPVVEEPTPTEPEEETVVAEQPTEETDSDTPTQGETEAPQQPPATEVTMIGTADTDTLVGGGANETIYGREGADRLKGRDGDDVLYGDEGRDKLFGGDGNDWLEGGVGRDLMSGGAGNDVLMLNNDGDIAFGGSGADTFVLSADAMTKRNLIRDFNSAEGDVLDVSAFVNANPEADLWLDVTTRGTMLVGGNDDQTVDLILLRDTLLDFSSVDDLVANGDLVF